MSFRKNVFSYCIWMIYIMCNCVVFSFLSMLCARLLPIPMPVAAIGLTVAFFGILFLIYFLSGILMKKYQTGRELMARKNRAAALSPRKQRALKKRVIWEGVMVISAVIIGFALRFYLLPQAGEDAAYYEVAKITADNTSILMTVQNSVYYYLYLLKGVFLLVGNHWIAGIWLQIFLQLLAALILYFAVRKTAGVFSAVAVLLYMMVSPSCVRGSLTYSPQMLYLVLWALGFLALGSYLKAVGGRAEKEKLKDNVLLWQGALLLGILTGFLVYVDISGAVLVVGALFIPMAASRKQKGGKWVARMFLTLLGVVLGFGAMLMLDSLMSHSGYQSILRAWLVTFQPKVPDVISLLQNSSLEVMVLLILMAVGVFSFYRRKDGDRLIFWICMTFVMAVLYVLGVTADNMNGRILLLILMAAVAAVSVRELFCAAPVPEGAEEGIRIIDMDAAVPEGTSKLSAAVPDRTPDLSAAVPGDSTDLSGTKMSGDKPRFLENPLPLPKKKIKKAMDYAFVPENAHMKFDVEISENDDFDV